MTLARGRSEPIAMPRQLRIEYPGAIDHVLNRGDRREPIFMVMGSVLTIDTATMKRPVLNVDTEDMLG